MGTIHHTAVVVTGPEDKRLTKAHKKAIKLFGKDSVTKLCGQGVNGYLSFMVAPTGSKMGWETQNTYLKNVDIFVKFLETFKYEDGSTSVKFVKLSYGELGLDVFDYRGNELYAEDK